MRNLSLGAGLVVRQLLFLTLMVFMGAAAYVGVVHLRDLTVVTSPVGPAQALAVLALAHDAANSLAIELAIGTVFSALLILSPPKSRRATTARSGCGARRRSAKRSSIIPSIFPPPPPSSAT